MKHGDKHEPITVLPLPTFRERIDHGGGNYSEFTRWGHGWPERKHVAVQSMYPRYGTTSRAAGFEDSLAEMPLPRVEDYEMVPMLEQSRVDHGIMLRETEYMFRFKERDPLQDVRGIVDASTFPEGHFRTAELDETGVVVLKDEQGNPTAWMPESVYRAFQEIGATERARELAASLSSAPTASKIPPAPMNRKERRAAAKRARSRR